MSQAEINVFLEDGAAHVKWVLQGEIDEYDDKGNPLRKDVTANEIAAALNGLWTALEAAGRKPSAIRKGGGGNPNWKPKPLVIAVKTNDGAELVVKCPKCGKDVYDNRAENNKREKDGLRRRPDFKCKDKECEGIIWNAVDVIAREDLQNNLNRPPEKVIADPEDLPYE